MPAALPTGEDVLAFLLGAGMVSISNTSQQESLNIDSAALAAVNEWELRTKWKPFLAEEEDSTEYYNGPDRDTLVLRHPYVSITSVTNGLSYTETTGTLLVEERDYWIEEPIDRIDFGGFTCGGKRSIKVIGKKGRQTVLDDLVFNSIVQLAALKLVPSIRTALNNGLVKWKRGDDEKTWGEKAFGASQDDWKTYTDENVKLYRRDPRVG